MCFCCKKWKGLIFLRSYLHSHLDRANFKKVQISSLRKLVNMTWRKTWPKCPWNFLTNCLSKSPLSHDDSFCKSDFISKQLLVQVTSYRLTNTKQWIDPPKRNTFHSKLKHLGMSIYLTIISNHSHLNISKIILSKRVMSFNKTHNRQLFSKPQNIL